MQGSTLIGAFAGKMRVSTQICGQESHVSRRRHENSRKLLFSATTLNKIFMPFTAAFLLLLLLLLLPDRR